MGNNENISSLLNSESGFAIEKNPEISVEQFFPELEGNCWTDDVPMASESTAGTGSFLHSNDDLDCDIQNFFGDEMFKQLGSSSTDETVGHINSSSTSRGKGIRLRTHEEMNQAGASDVQLQGNAVRRILLQQRFGPVYHCNHVISRPTEAKRMNSQEDVHLVNVKLASSRVETRKWPFMFASGGKSKRMPEHFRTSVSKARYNLASKKLKIWTAFAAVLFAVFIGLPAVKLLGK